MASLARTGIEMPLVILPVRCRASGTPVKEKTCAPVKEMSGKPDEAGSARINKGRVR